MASQDWQYKDKDVKEKLIQIYRDWRWLHLPWHPQNSEVTHKVFILGGGKQWNKGVSLPWAWCSPLKDPHCITACAEAVLYLQQHLLVYNFPVSSCRCSHGAPAECYSEISHFPRWADFTTPDQHKEAEKGAVSHPDQKWSTYLSTGGHHVIRTWDKIHTIKNDLTGPAPWPSG